MDIYGLTWVWRYGSTTKWAAIRTVQVARQGSLAMNLTQPRPVMCPGLRRQKTAVLSLEKWGKWVKQQRIHAFHGNPEIFWEILTGSFNFTHDASHESSENWMTLWRTAFLLRLWVQSVVFAFLAGGVVLALQAAPVCFS